MARSRVIKPGLFQNEFLAELGPEAMLVFAGLTTLADRDGWLEDRPKRIKALLLPYFNTDMDALLQLLADSPERFIERRKASDEHGGKRYIFIRNWHLHQSPHHTEKDSVIAPLFNGYLTSEELAPPYKVTSNKYKVTSSNEEVTGNEQQAPPKQKSATRPKSKPQPSGQFECWWEHVHAKIAKQAARKAYDLAVKRILVERRDYDPHEFLLERMQAFAASPRAHPADIQPIHPATWLNQGRFDDDPSTWELQPEVKQATSKKIQTAEEIFAEAAARKGTT